MLVTVPRKAIVGTLSWGMGVGNSGHSTHSLRLDSLWPGARLQVPPQPCLLLLGFCASSGTAGPPQVDSVSEKALSRYDKMFYI